MKLRDYLIILSVTLLLLCGVLWWQESACESDGGHIVRSVRGDGVCVNDQGEKL